MVIERLANTFQFNRPQGLAKVKSAKLSTDRNLIGNDVETHVQTSF
jgi:hypothetical protein